jgi:hypothetical protein
MKSVYGHQSGDVDEITSPSSSSHSVSNRIRIRCSGRIFAKARCDREEGTISDSVNSMALLRAGRRAVVQKVGAGTFFL